MAKHHITTLIQESFAEANQGDAVPASDPQDLVSIDMDLSANHDELCRLADQAQEYTTVLEQFPVGSIVTESEQRLLKSFVNATMAGTGISCESFELFERSPEGQRVTLSLESTGEGFWAAFMRIIRSILESIKKMFSWMGGSKEHLDAKQTKTEELIDKMTSDLEGLNNDEKQIDDTLAKGQAERGTVKVKASVLADYLLELNHPTLDLARLLETVGEDSIKSLERLKSMMTKIGDAGQELGDKLMDDIADLTKKNITTGVSDEQREKNQAALEAEFSRKLSEEQTAVFLKIIEQEGIEVSVHDRLSPKSRFVHLIGRWYFEIDPEKMHSRMFRDMTGVKEDEEITLTGVGATGLKVAYHTYRDKTGRMLTNGKEFTKDMLEDGNKEFGKFEERAKDIAGKMQVQRRLREVYLAQQKAQGNAARSVIKIIQLIFDLENHLHGWLAHA